MLPENRVTTHPGEILKEEFLEPLGVTQVTFAKHLGIPVQRVNFAYGTVVIISRPGIPSKSLGLWVTHRVFMSKVTLVIKLIIGKSAFKNLRGLDESTSPTDCRRDIQYCQLKERISGSKIPA